MTSTQPTPRPDGTPGSRPDGAPGSRPDEPFPVSGDQRPPGRVWAFRGLGVLAAALAWLALGSATGLEPAGRIVATIGVLMAVWWMTEALPLSATALVPIVAFPAFGVLSVGDATAPYADPIVFLFMGGFLIAIAMQKWNLHRRIALLTLRAVGTHPHRIVLGMMIATAFLSMWVSNTATTLMMLPIALSVLTLVVERSRGTGEVRRGSTISDTVDDPAVRIFGVGLVLSIAWSASIGGLGTLLGSPPNAIVAGYVSEQLDRDITFLGWMQLGVPLVVVFLVIAWLLITRVLFRSGLDEIPGGREMIAGQLRELGPTSTGEKRVLAVFAGAAFLWIVPGLLTRIGPVEAALPWLGELDDTAIAIAAGVVLFLLPGHRGTDDDRGEMLLVWDDAQKGLPWGVLLLFGGGLSLATAVAESGLDAWIGTQVEGLGVLPIVLLVAAVVAIVLLLTEVTSNTATAATFIPVLGGVALGIGADSMTLLIPAALAATCAFMLPVGTPPNAIVFGSGTVTIGQMARGGAALNVVGVLLITLFSWLLGGWALGLQF
ncbi:DASS family sodium-coupled anion symporter [Pseudonocardia sp. KRD-184]|uniref:Sodium-dependent dicarboxylate transporter SdcS n=1 Tax=Pseudonocardia oceani TaxID=2792013 RepID=A0ABS6UIH0_9PSEU|nr:DASS family sodium-coupled anion symporter [Pseudonocardia oceani]MBW0096838.1 DASS family sodium-coupled anion symporter [Pseudonocardia oceani]MBW0109473.1 DASS family sodium-coupled anion symporter [Pseudonocardia oceani]MBW0123641.1 DASS family sodium-coupled anion symporter [Pseudonocardia oceani]MBW0132052.1 DASS family sodium-coupled anion symporter [Pseudonocardia oceani]